MTDIECIKAFADGLKDHKKLKGRTLKFARLIAASADFDFALQIGSVGLATTQLRLALVRTYGRHSRIPKGLQRKLIDIGVWCGN